MLSYLVRSNDEEPDYVLDALKVARKVEVVRKIGRRFAGKEQNAKERKMHKKQCPLSFVASTLDSPLRRLPEDCD